jgi:hypothetical protein
VSPSVPGWLSRWLGARRSARERAKDIAATVEQVVEGTDPRLRGVGGYRRTLAPALARTLEFIDALVASLPGPIELSRRSWQDEPCVNAFFGAADDVPRTLTRSKELRDFFLHTAQAHEAFALLTLTRQEKSVLGMTLQGDMIQREVPQVSVGFVEPRILAPAVSERAAREEVRRRALNLFVLHAQNRLTELQARREGLEQERQIQQLRLRHARTRQQSLAAVEDDSDEIAGIEKALEENARALEALGGVRAPLEGQLEEVRAVFASPEGHLGIERVSLRVNRMGIKVEEGAAELAHELDLFEFSMGSARRVATLVRCPRAEMLTIEEFLGQVNPYLAAQMGIRAAGPQGQ